MRRRLIAVRRKHIEIPAPAASILSLWLRHQNAERSIDRGTNILVLVCHCDHIRRVLLAGCDHAGAYRRVMMMTSPPPPLLECKLHEKCQSP